MPYDFSRFSTQSFERFAQALATAQFGPTTQIYGAGPDGAREATFEGSCRWRPAEDEWNGYVVLQAKFHAKTGTPTEDLEWLKRQCDQELKKFQNPKRKLRKPDYYVVVTNIHLTPASARANGKGSGTLDLFLSHMSEWKKSLGVKEVVVWHDDVLSSLLDSNTSIRTTFSPWVTSGDVLSAALSSFARPEFSKVVHRVIRDELKDQRGVKTQDSGQAHGQQVYVDDVFVDLPLQPTSLFSFSDIAFEPTDGDNIEGDDPETEDDEEPNDFDDVPDDVFEVVNWNIANQVMERLSDKLDARSPSTRSGKRESYYRAVVMGGPGQGKSTIGQFLAQLLRARLLAPSMDVPPEVEAVVNATLARARAENIKLSGPARFPIHIALPRFADAISRTPEDPPSLLKFAAMNFARIAEEPVNVGDLRGWLSEYPSLIILDGLDEVPRTGNRTDVIRAIERLISDIHEANADTMVLVTSRPQGYLNDLDKKHWGHWHLAQLDTDNAKRFAARLAEVLVSDRTRRNEIISALGEAANDASTAPLMISPLQISLLFSLVVTSNDIPKDRWTLFQKHYEILRDREIAKGGSSGDLIRKYKSEIDRIHFDSGFILQVRAEKKGNASSHFTLEEFELLIQRNLSEAIIEHDDVLRVSAQVMVIATTRLVFLGDRNEGRIAFDVRSLQEFMAAARIMVSPEPKIRERLLEISLKSHWAHVFRIACSKIYAQAGLQELRSEVLTILDRLDAGDEGRDYREVRAGARLAAGLLADSTAGASEIDRARLMARAVKVLEIDAPEVIPALAAVADNVTRQVLSREIETHLLSAGYPHFEMSLRLLVVISRQVTHPLRDWAVDKLLRVNPTPEILRQLIDLPYPATAPKDCRPLLKRIMWAGGPSSARRWQRLPDADLSTLGGLTSEALTSGDVETSVTISGKAVSGLSVLFKPMDSLAGVQFSVPDDVAFHPGWLLVRASIAFSNEPNPHTLADAVEAYSPEAAEGTSLHDFPWPVALCLAAAARKGADLAAFILEIRNGTLGDANDWLLIELEWTNDGVALEKLLVSDLQIRKRDTSNLLSSAPPRRVRKHNEIANIVPYLRTMSSKWSSEQKLESLLLMAFIASTPSSALDLLRWIDDSVLEERWDEGVQRRVAGLAVRALNAEGGESAVRKISHKLSGVDRTIYHDRSLSSPLVKLFSDRTAVDWSANIILWKLNHDRKESKNALKELSAAAFIAPNGISPTTERAYILLRATAGYSEYSRLEDEADTLAQPVGDADCSSLLRLAYRGLREEDTLERLVCRTAEIALERGLGDRAELLDILTELISSRESNFDQSDCLTRLGLPADIVMAAA